MHPLNEKPMGNGCIDEAIHSASITPYNYWVQKLPSSPLLTEEEEKTLAIQWRDHEDRNAAKKLIVSHLRMVPPIVRNYRGYGIPDEDLIQQGNIGLMKAVQKFDPDRGYRLASMALSWIKYEIQQYIVDNWQIVRMVTTKPQRKLFFHKSELTNHLRPLQMEEKKDLALRLNVELRDVEEMEKRMGSRFLGLNEPISEEGDTWADIIPYQEPEEDAIKELAESDTLLEALDTLDHRTKTIVEARWFHNKTLQELSQQFNVSLERIRQIEVQGLKKMRSILEKHIH